MREGLTTALVFLTRLPVPLGAPAPLARAAPWFPVVGAGLGLGAGLVFAGLTLAGMPSFPAAIVVLAMLMVATGALHEDGLADCLDGLGPHDRARRLEVMRDSRIGSFAALGLILTTLARIAGLAALWDPVQQIAVLVVVGATSRGGMVALMALMPHARSDGLAATAGRPDRASVLIALALPALLAFTLLEPTRAMAFLGAAAAASLAWALVARRVFGGQTGDVLGAGQQLAETAMLLAATTFR